MPQRHTPSAWVEGHRTPGSRGSVRRSDRGLQSLSGAWAKVDTERAAGVATLRLARRWRGQPASSLTRGT
jgi:hypothetical protein